MSDQIEVYCESGSCWFVGFDNEEAGKLFIPLLLLRLIEDPEISVDDTMLLVDRLADGVLSETDSLNLTLRVGFAVDRDPGYGVDSDPAFDDTHWRFIEIQGDSPVADVGPTMIVINNFDEKRVFPREWHDQGLEIARALGARWSSSLPIQWRFPGEQLDLGFRGRG